MSLNLGELVGQIRADDSGWRHGLQEAQIRLAGFTRMTNGQLRDMHNNLVSESDAMGRTLGARITAGARSAVSALKSVSKGAAAVGVGLPAIAAVGAALGGLAAGAAAAGLAVQAFSLAAQPQMEAVREVADLAAEAEKAAAEGGAKAAEATKAYQDALSKLPSATQATAKSFIGLKSDFKAWSDSLSGTTMPIFTKGIEILRDLLPMLTPFVDAAATAFSSFLDKVAAGVKSAGFKEWADDMSQAAGPALTSFLTIIGNLGRGFASLLQAFLPASDGLTGGLVKMTGAFANWAASLKGSAGFEHFLDLAREGGALLGTLAAAAVQVLIAFAPLIGITTMIALKMAELINALPPDVVNALAMAIAAIVIGMKLWALWGAAVALATKLWAAAQWLLNSAFLANPLTWIVIAIIALVAAVIYAYNESETFRRIVDAVWAWIKEAISTAIDKIMAAIDWLREIPGKIQGWFEDAKAWAILKMAQLVIWLQGLPQRAYNAIRNLGSKLRTAANLGFQKMRDAAATKVASFITWVRGLPGRIASAIGNLGNLLYNKGMDIVRGLWNGIQSMGGWLRDTLMGWARDLIPGPIAKALGIASPSKLMADQIGRWIPAGVVEGIESGQGAVDRTMAGLVSAPRPGQSGTGAGAALSALSGRRSGQGVTTVRIELSGPEEVKRLIRTIVKNDGRGNVQTAFGR